MGTFSALLALCDGNPLADSPPKGKWREALMFYLICAWRHGWANNHRRWWIESPLRSLWPHCSDQPSEHRSLAETIYDVSVMSAYYREYIPKTGCVFRLLEALKLYGEVTPCGDTDVRCRSTLTRVMACYLTAPTHYLNQCWLISNEVLWHSPLDYFTGNAQYISLYINLTISNLWSQSLFPGSKELTHWGLDIWMPLRRRQCIFLNENVWISIKMSLKFVPTGPINNIPALVQIMAWRRPGDKPLSEALMVNLPTHICFSRPQWVWLLYIVTSCCSSGATGSRESD